MNNKTVYRHVNKDTLEVFYIGIGNKKRPYSKASRSKEWKEYTDNNNWYVDILVEDIPYEDACELEILLIEEYGRKHLGKGLLLNKTRGGEGVLDYQISGDLNPAKRQEVRKKISNKLKGKLNPMYGRTGEFNPFYGKKHSKEFLRRRQLTQSNPIEVYKNGELILKFECVSDCADYFNCTTKNILYRLRQKKEAKFGMFKDLNIKKIVKNE